MRDLGFADCRLVAFNRTGANQHVIVFRDDNWPHSGGADTLALTTVSFNEKTGELLNADMEVNTVQNRVSIADPVPADGYDLASILTHEAGHFFGLAHAHFTAASSHGKTLFELDSDRFSSGSPVYDTPPNPSTISQLPIANYCADVDVSVAVQSGDCHEPDASVPPALPRKGCENDTCEACVCAVRPQCCAGPNAAWDATCAALATSGAGNGCSTSCTSVITVPADRSQPMAYGANCDRLYRFSPGQLLAIRERCAANYTPAGADFSGRNYLFD